jgi:cyclohexanone monooxygenase
MTTIEESQDLQKPAIDKEKLRRKYMEERNKRLRADGNDQYIEVKGQLAHYLDDPYTPVTPRDPKTDHVTFAFIGGGFAGLATAARLTEAGVKDVRIIEKGGDFGGTWYWNRYPGAQCDTASMVYMPLLEETGHMPTEKYAHAPEILAHCRRIGTQFGLYDNALFHTQVTDLKWMKQIRAGSSTPTAATLLRRSSSAWAPGRCTFPSCRASRASKVSGDIRSTPAGGITTTPAAIRRARR